MSKKHYVMGLCIDRSAGLVLLVEKKQPAWQAGLLNGVGGKIEDDESPDDAMRREFKEETGISIPFASLRLIVILTCNGGTVYVYSIEPRPFPRATDLPGSNDVGERLIIADLDNLPNKCIPNIYWLVQLPFDNVQFPLMVNYREEESVTAR